MAGRIKDEDIATVRERARIDQVVSQYVTLRPAGGGSMKGLCPFHDEKTPSFNVRPSVGYFHCFGCAEGGDVISFLQKIEGLSFVEAVERLAEQAGVQLRYTEGGGPTGRPERGNRARLVEAHKLAAQFYVEQLFSSTEAAKGREFLAERGFDKDAAEHFGVGYAPRSGSPLLDLLRRKGFSDEELVTGGLVAQHNRGPYDRFRGRLIWPIRELSGDVVGFGARRLYDDDRIEAKYLNTPETPIYKKSHVLYGVDLARREIARRAQAVVVEGYTDVMAAHLAGVPTAVATCGTAFGTDHVRVLRRLLLDHDEFRGEVIFTFDGDEAGQRAALKAFEGDEHFVTQTYVAVEEDGLDPCDLRLRKGEAAVRDLIARRVPLPRFVLGSILGRYDLDRGDARVDALRASAPILLRVRDTGKRASYGRELAAMLGVEVEDVRAEVARAERRQARTGSPARAGPTGRQRAGDPVEAGPAADPTQPAQAAPAAAAAQLAQPSPVPTPGEDSVERQVLRLVVQWPTLVGPAFDALEEGVFTQPAYAAVRPTVAAAGGAATAVAGEAWVSALATQSPDEGVRGLITALAVEPLPVSGEPTPRYADSLVAHLQVLAVSRQIDDLKSKLQRTNPVEQTEIYNKAFGELIALEQHRRALRERAAGAAE